MEKEASELALAELNNHKLITNKEQVKINKLLKVSSLIGLASVVFPFCELLKRLYEFGRSD